MSEQKEVFGQIQIADEVIAIIAATAAMEVEGVLNASSLSGNALIEFFGKKNQSKGVRVEAENGEVSLELDLIVLFGVKVQDAAVLVQEKVKSSVETMTGLRVNAVDINIAGIVKEKPIKPAKVEQDRPIQEEP